MESRWEELGLILANTRHTHAHKHDTHTHTQPNKRARALSFSLPPSLPSLPISTHNQTNTIPPPTHTHTHKDAPLVVIARGVRVGGGVGAHFSDFGAESRRVELQRVLHDAVDRHTNAQWLIIKKQINNRTNKQINTQPANQKLVKVHASETKTNHRWFNDVCDFHSNSVQTSIAST